MLNFHEKLEAIALPCVRRRRHRRRRLTQRLRQRHNDEEDIFLMKELSNWVNLKQKNKILDF